jgi:hypothetical protein
MGEKHEKQGLLSFSQQREMNQLCSSLLHAQRRGLSKYVL